MKLLAGVVATPIIVLTWSHAASVADALVPINCGGGGSRPLPIAQQRMQLHLQPQNDAVANPNKSDSSSSRSNKKTSLLNLLSTVQPNQSTPKELTQEILQAAGVLENYCPTPMEDVLPQLAGNWELLWTAQDVSSLRKNKNNCLDGSRNPFATFINPLENQSYSNNPLGRSNPMLPQTIQDGLEDIGILEDQQNNSIRSTQIIDLKKNRIRNVVAFEANNPLPFFRNGNGKTKGFITVDVRGSPNPTDRRKIDVKFDRCRVAILDSSPKVDVSFPLGAVGPTGWLRTGYIDDDLRITRGHKGSVFILSRTAAKR